MECVWPGGPSTSQRIAIHFFSVLLLASAIWACAWGLLRSIHVPFPLFTAALLICALAESIVSVVEIAIRQLTSERVPSILNYDDTGLPESSKVAIVVPVQIYSIAQIERILERAIWNVRMANDSNVILILASDFPDRKRSPIRDGDIEQLRHLREAVDKANACLGDKFGNPIFAIHRHSVYSPNEGVWMGFERKRGKLRHVNDIILGLREPDWSSNDELVRRAREIKYVLCIDEDTKLTPNLVQRLAGLLDHPENTPVIGELGVERGYGLSVPQLLTEDVSLERWRLSRSIAGPRANSAANPKPLGNFSYRWFGRSKYNGKGMYDPHVYEVVCNTIPDGIVLSHDTIEGALLRPAAVPHAAMTEAFPRSHGAILSRSERWARGDVQNLYLAAASITKRMFKRPYMRLSETGLYTLLMSTLPLLSALAGFPFVVLVLLGGGGFLHLAVIVTCVGMGAYVRLTENILRDFRRGETGLIARVYPLYLVRIHLSILHRLMMLPAVFFVALWSISVSVKRLIRNRELLKWKSMYAVESERGISPLTVAPVAISGLALAILAYRQSLTLLGILIVSLGLLLPFADRILIRKD